ncbi:MAG TPA: methyltransferase [Acidimicrobiia bacterium]|nr:methyltransferase [Acidimicrobiia bacterium]
MRYGLIPDDPTEEAFLSSPIAPMAMIDSVVPLTQAMSLIVGSRRGVFEAMQDGPRTVDELAKSLEVDPGTLQLLLRILTAAGYVAQAGPGSYRLSDMGEAMVLDRSPARQTAWLRVIGREWSTFLHTDEVLTTGRGIDYHANLEDTEQWADYQASMLELARRFAPMVAGMVPVRAGAARLLDIGGSHGLYGALIARSHPPLRSEVLDLPNALEHAGKLAAAEGHDDIVTYRTGNCLVDDLGAGWDVVVLSQILHHFTPTEIADLLGRVRAATTPGATVAIFEVVQPAADDPPELLGDAFALFFRLTSTGRCYTTDEYTGWLTGAGFTDVQTQLLPLGRSLAVFTGRTPEADR